MATPNSPKGPKRAQNDPKKLKIQKVRKQEKSYKMKVNSRYAKPLKHISGLTLTLNKPDMAQ